MAAKMLAVAALAIPLVHALPQPGLSARDGKIIGGEPAVAGDFPFIVSITTSSYDGNWCGGTLVNANTIITAAHCSDNEASTYKVRAGSLKWAEGGQQVDVESITIHPEYDANVIDHDISVWKLASPIEEGEGISFAVLPEAGFDPAANTTVHVAGWGDLSLSGPAPDELQKVSIPVVDRAECAEDYAPEQMAITENMFCAGFLEGGKDHCYGDSGGPLVNDDGTLLGVVSWAKLCALPDFPGVNSNVGILMDFVSEHL